ncbi:MAG TPA: hypothetical protein VKI41_15050 [Vicinamibacteria bacterium]|nr:hypothetical protein [Vicinamibacteria bacterium]
MLYCGNAGAMNCPECQKDEQEILLNKCPICFKWICENCGHRAMGRVFCTKRCADQFFFGDDED